MIAAVGDTLRSRWIASGPQVAAFEARPLRLRRRAPRAHVHLRHRRDGGGARAPRRRARRRGDHARAELLRLRERDRARRRPRPSSWTSTSPPATSTSAAAAAAVTAAHEGPAARALQRPASTRARSPPSAQRHGVRILEDAALAIGSRAGGKPVGAAGDLVSFSFHPNKNMTTIEGGALVLNDAAEAQAVETLRFHGIARLRRRHARRRDGRRQVQPVRRLRAARAWRSSRAWTSGAAPASAWRRTTSPASTATTSSRRAAAPDARTPGTAGTCSRVLLPLDEMALTRKAVHGRHAGARASASAFPTRRSTSPRYYRGRGWREGQFPVSERIGRETVTLPLLPEMTAGDVERVCASARRASCGPAPRERHGQARASPSSSPSTTRRRSCPPSSRGSTRRSTRWAAPTRSSSSTTAAATAPPRCCASSSSERPDVTRVVLFNGNFGQHMAIMAGFEHCRGERVVTLDADLQNPPEEIGKLLAKMDEGHDYVGSHPRARARTRPGGAGPRGDEPAARAHHAHPHDRPGLHAARLRPRTSSTRSAPRAR